LDPSDQLNSHLTRAGSGPRSRVERVIRPLRGGAADATYTRPHGVRHLMAGLDLSRDKLYGHVTRRKGRTQFLALCRYLRSLYPADMRIAIVCDNFSPHLSTKTDGA
jgi:hypothetical protein